MKNIFNILILTITIFLLAGCSTKITVKSLHPSKISHKNIHLVHVKHFENDKLNQTEQIEEELSKHIINQKQVFKLKNNILGVDAIIEGRVLESSLEYDIYYKTDENRFRCRSYVYHEKTKTRTCVEYYERIIPCEKRDYTVSTKIKVSDPKNSTILFAKTYEKMKTTDQCFDNNYLHHGFNRDKKEINSRLAKEIAADFLQDISPHYKYYDLEVVDEIEDIKLSDSQKQMFESSIKLIDDKSYSFAKEKLEVLNKQLDFKSWEVLYNLALLNESFYELKKAEYLYEKASKLTSKEKNLKLISNSLNRVRNNLKEKIKAISQLP